jgi:acyl-CoA thioester hydrolase
MNITVEAADLDELDLVNNAVYLRYVETVARAHADLLGIGGEVIMAMNRAFVVRRHEIDYHLPARLGDVLTLRTRIEKFQGARAVRVVQIERNGEVLVVARTEWTFIDLETLRPVRMPKEFQAHVTIEE